MAEARASAIVACGWRRIGPQDSTPTNGDEYDVSGVADKIVLITGAGGGLGRAVAQQLAAQGAKLGLTDSNGIELDQTAALIRNAGGSVVVHTGDVVSPDTAAALIAKMDEVYGGIDAICNVAGVLGGGSIEEATAGEFDRVMHINCMSHLIMVQKALPLLRRSRRAAIVNVASVGALVALPLMSIYCASKAAVVGLTRAMALELAPDIRCNAICPGGIDSPMSQGFLSRFSTEEQEALLGKLTGRQLQKRFAQPSEIASLMVYLVSDDSSFLTGAILPVDAGHTSW